MKKAILILLFSPVYFTVMAQRATSSVAAGASQFSLGLEAGLPLGQNGKPYSAIIGGSLQYETMPASDLGITFNGGYLHFPIKSTYGSGSVGFVPLLAGVKYYFSPMAFFHAQLGAAVGTAKSQGTSFAYSPGIGIKFSRNIDAELKYMGISNKGGTLEDVGVRLAYIF